jgi:phosphatidylethanolamine/phosphatidyl-N-methylethanolamine N-methyltransferase
MTQNEKERSYWDRQAGSYDRAMRLLGRPIPRMVELTAEAVLGTTRVLEVAAGPGLVTAALAGAAQEVVATDYAPAMVEALAARVHAAGLTNVRCEQADIYALHFESASFDAAVAANVLHVIPDLPGALAALRRVLVPGGRLIAPTYCHDETALSWLTSRALAVTRFPGHRRFTVASLRESLEAAGLQVTRVETIPGLLPIGYVEGTFGAA